MSDAPSWGARLRRFLAEDVWSPELSSFSGLRNLAIRLIRISQLVLKGFREDDLQVHAAALTFSTLMSLVPLLALSFAALKGFGAAPDALARIQAAMADMPEGFRSFVDTILESVMRTTLVTLGWVGLVVLFVTVVQTLSSLETSFNRVWGVHTPRSWWRRVTNYISMTVVVPVLILAAFGIHATLQHRGVIEALGQAAPLYRALLRASPLLSVWLAFLVLIVFMPNTEVRKRPAAVSALVAAGLWILWQKIYINLQVSLAKYNAIYGTFASVPIFLLWLYVGCMIILLGAELAFALQNHHTYALERAAGHASVRSRTLLALLALVEAARGFAAGRKLDAHALAERQGVPIRLVLDVLRVLAAAGYLAEAAEPADCYVLTRPPEQIPVPEVARLLAAQGAPPAQLGLASLPPRFTEALERPDQSIANLIETA